MPDSPIRLILIDDRPEVLRDVSSWLRGVGGFEIATYEQPGLALRELDREFAGVLVTDLKMPDMDGLELLEAALAIDPELKVIVLTGEGDIALAGEARDRGAFAFIEKRFGPADLDRLLNAIRRAAQMRALVLEVRALRHQLNSADISGILLGRSSAIQQVRRDVLELAPTEINVIVRGETGTGKELVAQCLHKFSRRRGGPYRALNCARKIHDAEFFGTVKETFTQVGNNMGLFEFAHGGTLFLDEIESMTLEVQGTLLRVLEEKRVTRLGAHSERPADARIVCGTKIPLLDAVRRGDFREDLYYRLCGAEIYIPPLRERLEDLPLLFEHFVEQAREREKRLKEEVPARHPAYLQKLLAQPWKGNVRELHQEASTFVIGRSGLNLGNKTFPLTTLKEHLAACERVVIDNALKECKGNVSRAATMLDIPLTTLRDHIKRLKDRS